MTELPTSDDELATWCHEAFATKVLPSAHTLCYCWHCPCDGSQVYDWLHSMLVAVMLRNRNCHPWLAIYAGDLANGGKVSNYQRIKLMEESALPSIVNPKPRMERASVVLQQCRVMFVRKLESSELVIFKSWFSFVFVCLEAWLGILWGSFHRWVFSVLLCCRMTFWINMKRRTHLEKIYIYPFNGPFFLSL